MCEVVSSVDNSPISMKVPTRDIVKKTDERDRK